MKRQRSAVRLAATVAIAICTLGLAHVSSQGQRQGRRSTSWLDGREVVDGEVIVRYRAEAGGTIERQRAEFQSQADEVEVIGRRGMRRMRSQRIGTRAMIDALRNNPDVEFAEPNYVVRVGATPNDPSFGALWGLFNIGQSVNGSTGTAGADISALQAWDVTTGSRAHVIGVIDTGIDYRHPDLAANIWSAPYAFSVTVGGRVINCAAGSHGFNAITNTCDPMDDHYHGTHVAGTIGAVGNNGIGVAGVNWAASMMGLKFLSSSGSGSTADAIKAIEFAIQARAVLGSAANVRILSNSWGGGGYSQALKNQIDAAASAEMLFVAAAGNNGADNDVYPHYPSSYTSANMISVAATTGRDQRASFSNYGRNSVHLGAPGQTIVSTMPNNGYASLNGTSMATPQVSGVAALVLAACPMTTAALKTAILGSVDPIAAMNGITSTNGRLDANAAVRRCTPPSLLVNGVSGAVAAQGSSTIAVDVRNGPGFISDWVMMVPAGSAPQTWGSYVYLSGSKTRPSTGLSNATVYFQAPAAGGSFEFRLYENDAFNLRATSGIVAVSPANAVPIVSSVSPASVASGSPAFRVTVNGAGFNASSQILVNGNARTTTFVSAAALSTEIQASEVASAGSLAVSVATPAPGGGVSGNATLAVRPAPSLTVNGAAGAVTVASGSAITVGVNNGPGYLSDWVMMVPAGSPPQTWGAYQYLSGSKTRPSTGVSNATLAFTAPASGSAVEFRFYQNDSFALLATSGVVTISGSSSTPPGSPITINGSGAAISVAGGSQVVVGINNGPGNISDWVMMVPAGSPPQTWGQYMYLSGTKTRPATGMTSALLNVVAPAAGGSYEFRFYQNDTFTLIATSGVMTVTASQTLPALSVNGQSGPVTASAGSTITVNVTNGPGDISDWVMMVPAGSPAQTWGPYMYLSGSKTRPVTGLTAATLSFLAPSSGNVEFRFYKADTFTLLATSSIVTVTP